ncbi:unnamed protein product [Brassicogethes aeneus]|uniref:Synembryn-A n=1 Tax=Brassicogethes aeneus TaxID=1431903 RepID=A0A9P0FKJ0_BRAAE|nr:unnamed protein product [Brassicogethes aeneus]
MDVIAKEIISFEKDTVEEAVNKFLENATNVFQFPDLDKDNLRQDLWNALYDICNSSENNDLKYKCFSTIRILSREKTLLNSLVSEEWLELFKRESRLGNEEFTFNNENLKVALEAEKCLCNIVFNSISVASKCIQNGILENTLTRIKKFKEIQEDDIRFFDAKLLFIITAVRPESRRKVKDEMNGVTYLTEALEEILSETVSKNNFESNTRPNIFLTDMQTNITCEILKALFNITLHINEKDETEIKCFTNVVLILRKYLLIPTESADKRVMLQNDVINLLTNMPQQIYPSLLHPVSESDKLPKKLVYENFNFTAVYDVLLLLKSKFVADTTVSNQHGILSPTLTVLLKMAYSDRIMRKYLKAQILPPLKDVHNRPEHGDEIRNHLCKLLTTPITELRDLVAEFLFVLCKKNVTRMIKYTGYGNAAGLFAQRGLLGGKNIEAETEFSSDDVDSETEEYAELKHGINPVLGCYEEPRPNPMENMSEEQKEYEALRLVQLIDDLTKCGAIKPCRVGKDGKPEPIEHVLQLQEGIKAQSNYHNADDDSD